MHIDHVTVCGDDLGRMRQGFAAEGIETKYGGAHANGLTHMALAGFADGSYLELIAPMKGVDASGASGMMAGWLPLMTGNAGASAWAIQTWQIEREVSELRERGITVQGPERGGRTKPDGASLEWETAMVGPGSAGTVLPFMIQDHTARSLRVEATQTRVAVQGVTKVVIGVRELGSSIDLFRRAYEWPAPLLEDHPQFGARLADFADTPVILAEALSGNWLAQHVQTFGDGPVAFHLRSEKPLKSEENWFGQQVVSLNEEILGAKIALVA